MSDLSLRYRLCLSVDADDSRSISGVLVGGLFDDSHCGFGALLVGASEILYVLIGIDFGFAARVL